MRPIHVAGAGRAATALARLLHRAGHPVGSVVARTVESARSAVQIVGAGVAASDPVRAFADGAITLIGVPESALAPLAAQLGRSLPPLRDAVALHLSGSLPAEVLAPLRARGAAVGSLHPLAAFAERGQPPGSLAGVTFDADGDGPAVAAARELVQTLGGRLIELDGEGKALFHAAATVASNAFVALFDLAVRLAERSGASPDGAREAMAALAASTLANLARLGSPAALTGPIERGEADVVERHLQALARRAPAELPRYVELARATLKVARRKGSLAQERAAAIERLLAAHDAS